MGDMGDFYRDWDAIKKAAKEKRLAEALCTFDAWQDPMPGWTKHTPYHWSRDLCGDRMDYWPSTGKWRWRDRSYRGTPYSTAGFIANREAEHDTKEPSSDG